MPKFRPGQSGNPAGRPPGSRTKSNQEIQQIIFESVSFEDIVKKLAQKAGQGREAAAKILLEYAFGKPLSREELNIQHQPIDLEATAKAAQAMLDHLNEVEQDKKKLTTKR